MFKFDDKEFDKFADALKDDLGPDLVKELQNELMLVKDYYGERLTNTIEYDTTDKIVGSTHIAPLIINQGYPAGRFPNFDAIVEWVTNTKDGGKNKRESEWKIKKMAYAVAKKIEEEGIPRNTTAGKSVPYSRSISVPFLWQTMID